MKQISTKIIYLEMGLKKIRSVSETEVLVELITPILRPMTIDKHKKIQDKSQCILDVRLHPIQTFLI